MYGNVGVAPCILNLGGQLCSAEELPVSVRDPIIKTSLFPEEPGTNSCSKTRANSHNSEIMRPSSILQRKMGLVSGAGAIFCCCAGHDEGEARHYRAQQYTAAIPLQAWAGPEGSRRLRLSDFKTVDT